MMIEMVAEPGLLRDEDRQTLSDEEARTGEARNRRRVVLAQVRRDLVGAALDADGRRIPRAGRGRGDRLAGRLRTGVVASASPPRRRRPGPAYVGAPRRDRHRAPRRRRVGVLVGRLRSGRERPGRCGVGRPGHRARARRRRGLRPLADHVALAWNTASLSNGHAIDGYLVRRYAGSTPTTVCGSGATPHCTDAAVPDGTYTYGVSATFEKLTRAENSRIAVTVDTSAPVIDSAPQSPSANASPSFTFSDATYSSFRCRLDGAARASPRARARTR